MSGCVLHPGVTVLAYLTLSYLIIKLLYKLLRVFCVHILSRVWRTDLRKYGEWAVITGATDGIGKGYARELARRGFHIVLLSRTLEKLQRVAKEIEQESGRKVKIIQADFTGGCEIYPKIEEGLKDLDIGILVNNVGMLLRLEPGPFLCDSGDLTKGISDMLNCNIQSMLQMTRIVLPGMVQRKRCFLFCFFIHFLGKPCATKEFFEGLIPERCAHYNKLGKLFATKEYIEGLLPENCGHIKKPGTPRKLKVFMDFFSRSLNLEYRSKGITVQSLMPLFISTNMIRNPKSNLFVKTADDFAWEALNTVGLTHRTSGCLSHAIQNFILNTLLTDTTTTPKIIELIFGAIISKEKQN